MIDIDALLTIIFIFLPILAAFGCLYYTFYFLKIARSIEDNPTSKIRSAAQGYVELVGTSKPLNVPILGKLSQQPCIWYRYTIEELKTIRTSDQSLYNAQSIWHLLEQGSSIHPFLLEDATGECIILPEGATVLSPRAISWRGHTRKPYPPSTSFFGRLWNSWGRYRYIEYRLELNRTLFVHGMFMTVRATDLHIAENASLHAYVNDKKPSTVHLLLKDGLSSHEHFMLSAVPEKRLIWQFKLKALAFFIAFLFFVALSFNSTYPIIKKTLLEGPSKLQNESYYRI